MSQNKTKINEEKDIREIEVINIEEVSDKFEDKGKDFLVTIKSSYEKIFLNNKKSVKVPPTSTPNRYDIKI